MIQLPIHLSPDDTGGGTTGADQGAAPQGGELFSSETTQTAGGEGGQGGQGTPATPAVSTEAGPEPATEALRSPALTKEDIQELVSSISASRPTSQPQADTSTQQPPLSEEQLERMFNVWKPSAEFMAQLRHEQPEVALKALTMMRDGMMRQAMSMAEYRVQQLVNSLKEEITGQISPLNEYVSEARATAFRDDFFEANPDLEPYEQLVDAVAARLYQASGDQFLKLDRAGRMKLFADESKKLVQEMLAKGGVTAAGSTNGGNGGGRSPQASPPARRMSTLTSGGQPGSRGAGGGKASTGNKNVDAGLEALD